MEKESGKLTCESSLDRAKETVGADDKELVRAFNTALHEATYNCELLKEVKTSLQTDKMKKLSDEIEKLNVTTNKTQVQKKKQELKERELKLMAKIDMHKWIRDQLVAHDKDEPSSS